MLIWSAIGIIFGSLVDRFFHPKVRRPAVPDALPSHKAVGV